MTNTPSPFSSCPICGHPTDKHYKPFCSKKCADIDLGRWLKGTYVIHTDEKPETEDTPALYEQEETPR